MSLARCRNISMLSLISKKTSFSLRDSDALEHSGNPIPIGPVPDSNVCGVNPVHQISFLSMQMEDLHKI